LTLAECAFLADENIDPEVVGFLSRAGCDVVTVLDVGLGGRSDEEILAHAFRERRVVLTHDSDFGSLAIARGRPVFGLLFLRPGHTRAEFTIKTLSAVMARRFDVPIPCLIVASQTRSVIRMRIRRLANAS
jgi:predicted nuclease of predicted toxin-antitoxin system